MWAFHVLYDGMDYVTTFLSYDITGILKLERPPTRSGKNVPDDGGKATSVMFIVMLKE